MGCAAVVVTLVVVTGLVVVVTGLVVVARGLVVVVGPVVAVVAGRVVVVDGLLVVTASLVVTGFVVEVTVFTECDTDAEAVLSSFEAVKSVSSVICETLDVSVGITAISVNADSAAVVYSSISDKVVRKVVSGSLRFLT